MGIVFIFVIVLQETLLTLKKALFYMWKKLKFIKVAEFTQRHRITGVKWHSHVGSVTSEIRNCVYWDACSCPRPPSLSLYLFKFFIFLKFFLLSASGQLFSIVVYCPPSYHFDNFSLLDLFPIICISDLPLLKGKQFWVPLCLCNQHGHVY